MFRIARLHRTSHAALGVSLLLASGSVAAQAIPAAQPLSAIDVAGAPAEHLLLADTTAQPFAAGAVSSSALPDAPSSLPLRASVPPGDPLPAEDAGQPAPGTVTAGKYNKLIFPNETAQNLSGGDKIAIGFRDMISPINLAGAVLSAGYEQVLNGSPNYGTNREAFAKRFGAGMARGSSQGLFTDGILAAAFHTDPRYYVRGSDHSFVNRSVYAVSRVFVTRTDGGRNTVNAPLLVGYAGAAALSRTYYPAINRNFKDTASDFGGSLGGAALGFLVNEFSGPILEAVHLKKKS